MKLEFKLNSTFSTDVDIEDVIEAMNELTIQQRWNYLAKLINHVEVNGENLNEVQRKLILTWLEKQTEHFRETLKLDEVKE